MAAQRKYPEELRERAVKMVLEIRERDGKGHGEIARVGRADVIGKAHKDGSSARASRAGDPPRTHDCAARRVTTGGRLTGVTASP